MSLWGGRFDDAPDPIFTRINDSLPFDARLMAEDIAGSRAWARGLGGAGVLTTDEVERIVAALDEIERSVHDTPALLTDARDEDIHTWVERQLVERVGDLGKKLHTGRSRNDQVATDLRLWLRAAMDRRRQDLAALRRALVDLADREGDAAIPGYAHRQRAQPILFGHWCLAFFEMFGRDDGRFDDAVRRANDCPLGSAALAGTTFPVDRDAIAAELAFDGPTSNSLDAVSDRDFIIETLAAAALCGVHLSRLADDVIFFATGEADFVDLADDMTSGSSLMPQKKNPDALELVRAKSAGLIGALVSASVTLKGLPLAYNKDQQELTPILFDALDALELGLVATARVLATLRVRRASAERAALGGYANATELADYLVERDIPFRTAHEITGRIVRHAIERGQPIEALPLDELRRFAPEIDEDVRDCLGLEATLARRDVHGGTAPRQVREAIARARHELGASTRA